MVTVIPAKVTLTYNANTANGGSRHCPRHGEWRVWRCGDSALHV